MTTDEMTLDAFLDLVPWAEMQCEKFHMSGHGLIRHVRDRACPIVAVWGGMNTSAVATAVAHGLPAPVARLVVDAADDDCREEDARGWSTHEELHWRAVADLRGRMLARIPS